MSALLNIFKIGSASNKADSRKSALREWVKDPDFVRQRDEWLFDADDSLAILSRLNSPRRAMSTQLNSMHEKFQAKLDGLMMHIGFPINYLRERVVEKTIAANVDSRYPDGSPRLEIIQKAVKESIEQNGGYQGVSDFSVFDAKVQILKNDDPEIFVRFAIGTLTGTDSVFYKKALEDCKSGKYNKIPTESCWQIIEGNFNARDSMRGGNVNANSDLPKG